MRQATVDQDIKNQAGSDLMMQINTRKYLRSDRNCLAGKEENSLRKETYDDLKSKSHACLNRQADPSKLSS